MRSSTASGTRTPGTSFAMNSAFSTLSNGQSPRMIGSFADSIASKNRSNVADVEHRLRHRELGARLDLVFEPPNLAVQVFGARVDLHADMKRRRTADRLTADIEAVVQAGRRRW